MMSFSQNIDPTSRPKKVAPYRRKHHPDYPGTVKSLPPLADIPYEERRVRFANPDSPYPIPRMPYVLLPADFPATDLLRPGTPQQFAMSLKPIGDPWFDYSRDIGPDECLESGWTDKGTGNIDGIDFRRMSYAIWRGEPKRFIYRTDDCSHPDECLNPAHLVTTGVARKTKALSDDEVIEMRRLYHEVGADSPVIGKQFGVSRMTAYKVCVGLMYPDVPMPETLRKPKSKKGKRVGEPKHALRACPPDIAVIARNMYHVQNQSLVAVRTWLASKGVKMNTTAVHRMLAGTSYADIPMPSDTHVRQQGRRRLVADSTALEIRRLYHDEHMSAPDIKQRLRLDVDLATVKNIANGWVYQNLPMPETVRAARSRGSRSLTRNDVWEIRRRYRNSEPASGIASDFNVSNSLVSDIACGKTYTDVPDETGRPYVPPLPRWSRATEVERQRVRSLIEADPSRSNYSIASEIGRSHGVVARIRREMGL